MFLERETSETEFTGICMEVAKALTEEKLLTKEEKLRFLELVRNGEDQ